METKGRTLLTLELASEKQVPAHVEDLGRLITQRGA
jgi:hypothetical protein